MPNHVHLIAVPETEDGLRRAIGEAHRRYTRYINFQKGWKGHLWQGKFSSCPMDEMFLFAAARSIALNPVKAILVKVEPLAGLIGNWRELLASDLTDKEYETIRRHERTGHPMGDVSFLGMLEKLTGRFFQRQKLARKRKIR